MYILQDGKNVIYQDERGKSSTVKIKDIFYLNHDDQYISLMCNGKIKKILLP